MNRVQTRAKRGKFLALLASFAMVVAGVLGLAVAAPAGAAPAPVTAGTINLKPAHVGAYAATFGSKDTDCANASGTDGWHFVVPSGYIVDRATFTAAFSSGSFTVTKWQIANSKDKGVYVQTAPGVQLLSASVYASDGTQVLNLSHTCPANVPPAPKPLPDRTIYNCDGSTTQAQVWDADAKKYVWPALPSGYSLTQPSKQQCATPLPDRTIYTCGSSMTQAQVWDKGTEAYVWPSLPTGYSLTQPSKADCATQLPDRTIYSCTDSMTQAQVWDKDAEIYVWPSLPAGYSLTQPSKEQCATPLPDRTIYSCAGSTTQAQVWNEQSEAYVWPSLPTGFSLTEPTQQQCQAPDPCEENPEAEGCTTPDPDPQPKPETTTYTDNATLAASQEICTVNGTVTVDVKGNGRGESTVSQSDAKKVAEGNAQLDLDYNLKMAKAQFPGATDGACAPVTTPVVEPAVVEPPAEELSSVAVPAAATVQQAPEAVAVPAAATVPTAVPAGEGPADSGFPTWALALIVLGAAGAAITGAQALKKQ